jgi:hypothetical protein
MDIRVIMSRDWKIKSLIYTLYVVLFKMSEESEIQAEVEALRERFSDTKALYREVCALLFFRYGITPTASKLYQHVRKGSMSAPAEALAKFWEDLRGKARVEIDHPDLPEALKEAAGQAVSVLWTQATELAREELAVLRVEAHASKPRVPRQSCRRLCSEAPSWRPRYRPHRPKSPNWRPELRPLLQSLSKSGVRTLRAQREVRHCPGRWMS